MRSCLRTGTARGRVLIGLIALTPLCACGGPAAVRAPVALAGAPEPALPAGAFVASARGLSAEAARTAAQDAVARHFLGHALSGGLPAPGDPPLEEALLAQHTHRASEQADGREVSVSLWVDVEGLRQAALTHVAALGEPVWPAGPLRTREAIEAAARALRHAEQRASLCTLAQQAGAAPCPGDETTTTLAALVAEAAAAVTLTVQPLPGVPHRPGHLPLSPLVIGAHTHGDAGPVPWAELPLRVHAPAGLLAATEVQTDAQGRVSIAWLRPLAAEERVAVEVDAVALMGAPLAATWPRVPVEVPMRALTFNSLRVRLEVTSTSRPGDVLVSLGRGTLMHALSSALPGAEISGASAAPPAAQSPHDVLVSADVHWAFASALGGRSVWYEARASLEGTDAWGGEHFVKSDVTVQEAGLGEQHAAKQAVIKLARALGQKVAEALKQTYPTSGAAAGVVPEASAQK
ncbi:MAG: hypothetical protein KA712_08335 [Myxococcales bacterium]|nr:hypothetical protein [Myxococcales bacterium]